MKKRFLVAIILGTAMMVQTACGTGAETSGDVAENAQTATETAEETTAPEAAAETSVAEQAEDTVAEADLEEYKSADGWSITYDKNLFMLGEIDEHTTQFNYLGECPGTTLMAVEYSADKTPDEVFLEKKESWSGTIRAMDSTIPNTDDKKGYCIQGIPDADSNGMSETWYISEYNSGTLTLELLTHISGKDEIDIPVSDSMSALLYSLKFDNYEEQKNYSPATSENYVGEWAESTAERVVATIAKSEDGSGYDVEITWREELPQKDVYTMHIDGEEPEDWFYSDGTHVIRSFNDDGTYTDEVQYENGNGYFYYCKADGLLYWADYTVEELSESITTFKVADFQ